MRKFTLNRFPYQKFADRFLAYPHRGGYIRELLLQFTLSLFQNKEFADTETQGRNQLFISGGGQFS